MKIEHIALNVKHPLAVSDWYEAHLGMTVVKKMTSSPYMTFLADESGKVMIELYNNPDAEILDYANLHPLMVHLAFVSENPEEEKERMQKAGAVLISDDTLEDGTRLLMMRDPWGLAIQFCKRAHPMLK
ncbi:VOC family protein [Cyclobacterium amurskyense]|jgi:catechol 2,3-dioxygenase-like lactoylglutathione lyase family enzyme|uniref:VOC family protein n=1 Tax=Cyclobacterium amurskyense TaxID=320787 RepID=UPI0030DD98FC|tara:strand:+ start:339 stop:725 length:387 start_codon:yes stop_codon:yes gene_type:complete